VAAAALALVLPGALLSTAQVFVAAPRTSPAPYAAGAAAVAAAAVLAPLAAHAELPPLEDLPLEGLKGGFLQERELEVVSELTWEFFGMQVPVALFTVPLFLIPPMMAATWAFTWVTNTQPFDSKLKTYLGAGALPPQGYTNPLDVRLTDDDDDDLPPVKERILDRKRKTSTSNGGMSGKSAVV
jgi:hypothetical protein